MSDFTMNASDSKVQNAIRLVMSVHNLNINSCLLQFGVIPVIRGGKIKDY